MTLQYSGRSDVRSWDTAYTVLIGIILLAVLPFSFLFLIKNRYGRDPARRFVLWLQASFCLFCLTLCLLFTQAVIATCSVHKVSTNRDIIRAAFQIGYLAELFRVLSAATTMGLLLELGPGMHYALHGLCSKFDQAVRYGAYVLAAVIAATAIAFYGLSVDFHLRFTNGMGVMNPHDARAYERAKTINEMIAATSIILWVASLVIMVIAVVAFLQRKMSPLKGASTLYLVASLLNVVGSTWNLAYAINWLLDMRHAPGQYVLILQTVLAWWTRGVALMVVFFIAVKSGPNCGVWSGTRKGGSIDARTSYNSDLYFHA